MKKTPAACRKSGRRHVTAPMRCRLRSTTRMWPRPAGDLATSGFLRLSPRISGTVEQLSSFSLRSGTAEAEVVVVARRVGVVAKGRAEGAAVEDEATAAYDPDRAANRTGRV